MSTFEAASGKHAAPLPARIVHDPGSPEDKPQAWRCWVYPTNHKDIGTMYLIFTGVGFFIGGTMAILVRLGLFKPGMYFFDPLFINSMTTTHALEMIFGAVIPAWTGLANWTVPLQVRAPGMALTVFNDFSLWMLPVAFIFLSSTSFVPGGRRPDPTRCQVVHQCASQERG